MAGKRAAARAARAARAAAEKEAVTPTVSDPVVSSPTMMADPRQQVKAAPVAAPTLRPVVSAPVKTAPVAPTNNNRALEIMKMATGSITPDMLYDLNKDGRVTSADALLYQKNLVADTSNSFVEPVVEEVVDLNADPFASTVSSFDAVQESLIPKAPATGQWDSRIPPMIWDASRKMNVPNPAYVAPDYSGLELLNSLGTAYDFSNIAEVSKQIQQQETEKYGLIAQPEDFNALESVDTAAQNIYLDEANKMIKDFGVEKEDAVQWYSDILEFTEDRPVYGLDVSPELSGLAEQKTQLQDEGYVNKANEWVNELEGLKQQDPASFTSSFNEMPTQSKLQYLYSAYEKGDLTEDQYKENFKNTVNANYDPQTNPNTKIIIDIKGNDYLVDADSVYGQMTDPFFLKSGAFYADDSLYFPSEKMSEGAWLQSIGSGQKSAEDKISDLLEPSTASFFLNNPVTQIAGLVIPGFSAATTLAKVATGEDVSPMEIASGLLTGLEMSGAIKAPATFDNGEYGGALGGVDPFSADLGTAVADAGTGLFGTTYAQTKAALNVAAAGDAKGAAIALVGSDLIKGGLDKVGLDQEVIEKAGIQYDDFEAGLEKTVQKVAAGEELDEALAFGVGKYVQEGGTLGSIDLPETNIDLGVIEDVVRDVVRPIGKVGTALADFVEEAIPEDIDKIEDALKEIGRTTDDLVLQPTKEVVQAVTEPVYKEVKEAVPIIEDVIREVGSETEDIVKAVAEPVIETAEPVIKAVGEIGENVVKTVGSAIEAGVETVDELLSPIGSAVEDIARATGSTVEDVLRGVGSLADDIRKDIGEVGQDVIDAISPIGSALEDVVRATGSNLEDLVKQLARMMSGALGSISLQQQEQARQDRMQAALNTRTTDSLFGEDVFKFQTEIGYSNDLFATGKQRIA
jgi:hypothetical protein